VTDRGQSAPVSADSARQVEGARAVVLARIRAALADAPAPKPVPRDYRRLGNLGRDEVLELFEERTAEYRATVHHVPSAQAGATIDAALAADGITSVVVPAGLPADWRPSRARVIEDGEDSPLSHDELDSIAGVVVGAAVGIAETGTIVLDGSPEQGRRVITLLPDHLTCVIRASQVEQTVPQALARLDGTRALTFISGPSATSDIELNRVEGVHGPRVLVVVILKDS
jgi:L-lactate dehydrogenase complex protein LldG